MHNTVLILANSIAGLYSFRKEVVAAIVIKGYRVVISAPHDLTERENYFINIGCELVFTEVDRRGTNPIRDIRLIRQYKRLIVKYRPFVALTYTIKPNIYGGLVSHLLGVPQVANITGLGTTIENPGALHELTIFMYRIGLKYATMVFYPNESIRDFCCKYHIGSLGRLLPGSGVNLEWHTYQSYPDEDDKMIFNFIGRVMKDKGIEEFLEMAEVIHSKYPQTLFRVIGDCEEHYEEKLKELQERGVVIWVGSVSDVRPYLKDSFCTIHPSYHEGMANVILESCAAGRPSIASYINGCKEAIDDGISGLLCEVRNTSDLIKKVEEFVSFPHLKKVEMGKAARKKVESCFDRKIVVEEYLSVISQVASRSAI